MAETREKLYRSLQEEHRDRAEAAAHGWQVVARDSVPQGYRVTYQLAAEWSSESDERSRPGPRKATLLIILWTVALAAAWLLAGPWAQGIFGGAVAEDLDNVGRPTILAIWFVGFLVISAIWLISRPRRR
jgi:hypothetical protein